MDKATRYSAVPVGKNFILNGITYTKTSAGRAYCLTRPCNIPGPEKREYVYIKKHQLVRWVNVYPSNLEA